MSKGMQIACSDLASQEIDKNGPGSILRDFETLLEFLKPGVRSTGKYHMLPIARLFELDEMMTKPLRPRLQRPQQRSFPHLNALYLLLRATQLGVSEGKGKSSGQLKLDPVLHEQWLRLNPTEQYFNLLEAWLRRGTWDPAGSHRSRLINQLALNVREMWMSIPPEGRRFSKKEQQRKDFFYHVNQYGTLALFELFGLMTVEGCEPDTGQSWCVSNICHTPFGDQLLGMVFEEIFRTFRDDTSSDADFGKWQPLFQPWFPEWVNNLKFPEPEFREGTWYFKVSLGEPWRRIAIPAQFSLDDLADCILQAFEFDGDHLYAFNYLSRHSRQVQIEHPYVRDAEMWTDEVPIGKLPLSEGQSMQFRYDFGEDWRFEVMLEEIKPAGGKISEPTIVASTGKAPAEYDDTGW